MACLDLSTQFCLGLLLAHRAVDPPPSSSLAEERTPPLAPPPCGGARFPTLAACGLILTRTPNKPIALSAISGRFWAKGQQPRTVEYHSQATCQE